MASVLIERETVDKEELAALLDNKWDEFLIKEAADKAAKGDSGEKDEPPASAFEEPQRQSPVAEPPMAPGTPPVLGPQG